MIDLDTLSFVFKDVNGADLGTKVSLFIFAWVLINRSVNKHFKEIRNDLLEFKDIFNELKDSLIKLETGHGIRLDNIEKEISKIKTKKGIKNDNSI